MNAVSARLRGAWARVKRKLGMNAPGWPAPPRNEDHATYRRQYEAILPVLRGLPRGETFEERNAFLFLAELLVGLHNYGDDPILPPGVRRMVIRENATRLQAFGEVGAPSLMGRVTASLIPFLPYILIGGILLSVTGWGAGLVNGWRADRFEAQRDDAREAAQTNAEAAARWRERSEEYRLGLIDAANVARNAAVALQAEREADARRAARERRRTREIQNVITGGPEPEWRLRDDPAAEDQQPAP